MTKGRKIETKVRQSKTFLCQRFLMVEGNKEWSLIFPPDIGEVRLFSAGFIRLDKNNFAFESASKGSRTWKSIKEVYYSSPSCILKSPSKTVGEDYSTARTHQNGIKV